MKKNMINPEFLSDTNTFKFVPVPSMYYGFTDVYYGNEKIAIINGISSPLQWTAKNGQNIPYSVIDKLENMVKSLIEKTAQGK